MVKALSCSPDHRWSAEAPSSEPTQRQEEDISLLQAQIPNIGVREYHHGGQELLVTYLAGRTVFLESIWTLGTR